VTVDRNRAAALSLAQIGSFDSAGGGQVQVAQDARRTCAAAGLRASRGTARGSNEPLVAGPDAGEHRGVPLRVDGTSCKGMPWPLNRDEIHHQALHCSPTGPT
jgi:hypothetical protein